MFTRTAIARSRLVWSRWLVLALMTLCLPLQGALAVTMKVCAMPVDQSAAAHAMPSHAVDGAGQACCPEAAVPARAAHAAHGHAAADDTRESLDADPAGGSHRLNHAIAMSSAGGGNPDTSDINSTGADISGGGSDISGGGTSSGDTHTHSHSHSDTHSDSHSDFSGSHAPACHTTSDGAPAQHDCSVCAQCSVGAAMMPFSLPLLPAVKPADVLPALNARAAAPTWPRSLDRPPKPILA